MNVNESEIIGNHGTAFDLRWDGWSGELRLFPTTWPNAANELVTTTRSYSVRYTIIHDAQDNVEKMTGPGYVGAPTSHGHRIVFWVAVDEGEQRFDGYLFTVTGGDAMAGIVWWRDMPYGFYGIRRYRIPG